MLPIGPSRPQPKVWIGSIYNPYNWPRDYRARFKIGFRPAHSHLELETRQDVMVVGCPYLMLFGTSPEFCPSPLEHPPELSELKDTVEIGWLGTLKFIDPFWIWREYSLLGWLHLHTSSIIEKNRFE